MNWIRENYKWLTIVFLLVFFGFLFHNDLRKQIPPRYQIAGAGDNKAFVLDTQTGELWLRAPGLSLFCGDNDNPERDRIVHYESSSSEKPSLEDQLAERISQIRDLNE